MSISGVSGVSPATASQAGSVTRKDQVALWSQLGKSLTAGNVSGAQTAFAALTGIYDQNHPAGSSGAAGAGSGASTPLKTDVASLAKALNAGDLSGAQAAFAQLQTDRKAAQSTSTSSSSSSVDVLA